MKKKKSGVRGSKPQGKPGTASPFGFVLVLFVVLVVGAVAFWKRDRGDGTLESSPPKFAGKKPVEPYHPRPSGTITFNKDIAPIIFANCTECHRPGQPSPFNLVTYEDVKKRARQIARVTHDQIMPPWLPEPGLLEFVNSRILTVQQKGLVQQWVDEGVPEGVAADLPALPTWDDEWRLGKPDLVLTMPKPFPMAPEGHDIYRNFTIPIDGLEKPRYVRAVEFRPGKSQVVHHAFIRVVKSRQFRRFDGADRTPGFPGMSLSSDEVPTGHFLGWQPGRPPAEMQKGLAWTLEPGQDLVLLTHLNHTGKPEELQASVGLYFTDEPPTNTPFKMVLSSYTMEIPAGQTNYVVEDNFVLPIDVQVLSILPHAHYLAREMYGWATLPGGEVKSLLEIKQWDFNWQTDYKYKEPIQLPRGTKLSMRFVYDNSTNNARNPNFPPKEVAHGSETTDEMAEFWIQLLPKNGPELETLSIEYNAHLARNLVDGDLVALRRNPNDAKAHVSLGSLLYNQNKLEEAGRHFQAAIRIDPSFARAHYYLGLLYRRQNNLAAARQAFERVIELDPTDSKPHGNLGYIMAELGKPEAALAHFSTALKLNPDDTIARSGYDELMALRRGTIR